MSSCAQLNVTSDMVDDHNTSKNVTDVVLVHEDQTSTPPPKRQKYCTCRPEINEFGNQCLAPKCSSHYPLQANRMRSATICKTCSYRMRNQNKWKRLQEGKQSLLTLAEQQEAMKKLQTTLSSEVVEKRTLEASIPPSRQSATGLPLQLRVEMDLRTENGKLLDEKAIYLQKKIAALQPQNEEVTALRKQYDENVKTLMDELRAKTQNCNALESHYKLLAGLVQGLQNRQDLQKPKAQLRPKPPFELSRGRSTTLCHMASLPPVQSGSWNTARTLATTTTKKSHTGLSLQSKEKVFTCDQARTIMKSYVQIGSDLSGAVCSVKLFNVEGLGTPVVSKHANLPECNPGKRMRLLEGIRDEMFNHINWMVTLNSRQSIQKEIKLGRRPFPEIIHCGETNFDLSGVGMGRAPFCCETWTGESLWHIMNHAQKGSNFQHFHFSASYDENIIITLDRVDMLKAMVHLSLRLVKERVLHRDTSFANITFSQANDGSVYASAIDFGHMCEWVTPDERQVSISRKFAGPLRLSKKPGSVCPSGPGIKQMKEKHPHEHKYVESKGEELAKTWENALIGFRNIINFDRV
eukprot:g1130.t1